MSSVPGEARIRIETGKADAERRMRSAVDDIMDGGMSITEASRNRKVDYDALRAELDRRGWKHIRVRNRRSRARRVP